MRTDCQEYDGAELIRQADTCTLSVAQRERLIAIAETVHQAMEAVGE